MAKIMTTSPVFNFWVTFSSPKTDQKDEEETDLQKSQISDRGQKSSWFLGLVWVQLASCGAISCNKKRLIEGKDDISSQKRNAISGSGIRGGRKRK